MGEIRSSSFTCEICIEPMSHVDQFNNSGRCIHPFCTDCLAKYIQAKVVDNVAANINCPAPNCDQLLDPLVCQPLVSPELFGKWCDRLFEASLSGLNTCYCPYQNCSALVVDECGEEGLKKSKCPDCKKFFCFTCKVPWHAGFWCSAARATRLRRDAGDAAFAVLVKKKKWKKCPDCGQVIELIGGCRQVKCRSKGVWCQSCAVHIDRPEIADGKLCCSFCGRVVSEDNWSEEVTFAKDAGGQVSIAANTASKEKTQ